MRTFIRHLTAADAVTVLFLSGLSVLAAIFASRIPEWHLVIGANTIVSVFLVWAAPRSTVRPSRALQFVRDWYPVPMIFYVFKLTYLMVHPIQPYDYDWMFIRADRWIFGGDPTHWTMQFAHPVLTEILQLCYSSYYLLFLVVAYGLYRRGMFNEFHTGVFLVVYGFYLSYIGYFVVPGVGPRFTLHDFHAINQELPGLWLTYYLREFTNAGESIPAGAAAAIDHVQRDIFPSGHTQLTLVLMYIAIRNRLASRWGLLIVGSLLVLATVYLRYHYVVDVIAGIAFFLFTIWSGLKLERWWRRTRSKRSEVSSSVQEGA